jgi:hypothetical protein
VKLIGGKPILAPPKDGKIREVPLPEWVGVAQFDDPIGEVVACPGATPTRIRTCARASSTRPDDLCGFTSSPVPPAGHFVHLCRDDLRFGAVD